MAIVKVQRPLFNTGERASRDQCLVYAQHRTMRSVQPVPDHAWAILGGRPGGRAFFQATWNADTQLWEIGDQVGDRNW
jgi:hypothetical protein